MSQLAIIDLNVVTGKHLNTACFKFLRGFPQKSKYFNHIFAGNKKLLFLLLLSLLLLLLLLPLLLLLTDYLTHCFNSGFMHLRLSNNKLWAQESLGGFEQCVGGQFSATQLAEFQYLFPLTILLTLCVLFLARLSLVIWFHIFLNYRTKSW